MIKSLLVWGCILFRLSHGIVFLDPAAPNSLFDLLLKESYPVTRIPGSNITTIIVTSKSSQSKPFIAQMLANTNPPPFTIIFIGKLGLESLVTNVKSNAWTPAVPLSNFSYSICNNNTYYPQLTPDATWTLQYSSSPRVSNKYLTLLCKGTPANNLTCPGILPLSGGSEICATWSQNSVTTVWLTGLARQRMTPTGRQAFEAIFMAYDYRGIASGNEASMTAWNGLLIDQVRSGELPSPKTTPETSLYALVWLAVLGTAIGISCCFCMGGFALYGEFQFDMGLLVFCICWIAAGVFLLLFILAGYPNTFSEARSFNDILQCTGKEVERVSQTSNTVRNLVIVSLVFRIIMYSYPCFLAFTEGSGWRQNHGYNSSKTMVDTENCYQMGGLCIVGGTFFMDMSTIILQYAVTNNMKTVLTASFQSANCMRSTPWENQRLLWVQANLLEIRSMLFVIFFTHPITAAIVVACSAGCAAW